MHLGKPMQSMGSWFMMWGHNIRDFEMADCLNQVGTAALYLGAINILIIKAAGEARQGATDAAPGATSPGSIAAGAVDRVTLTRPLPGGKSAPVTPLGYKTAVRRLPRVFKALDDTDPRRRALVALADAAEKIGSVGGANLSGTATKSKQSDGGATTRVKHATRLRVIQALANGWPINPAPGTPARPEAVALAVGRQTGSLKEIKVYAALWAIMVDGIPADVLLRQNGWWATTATRKKLTASLLAAADDIADGLGFGRHSEKTV